MSNVRRSSRKRGRPSSEVEPAREEKVQPPPGFTGPLIVFAHGAGAGAESRFMVDWSSRLSTCLSSPVHTFDFLYLANQRKGAPSAMPTLVRELRTAVKQASSDHPEAAARGVVLAGKSMGSRAACYLAEAPDAQEFKLKACLCFGYPIGNEKNAANANGKERYALAERLALPALFIHGTRDRIATIDRMREVVKARKDAGRAVTKLHVVEAGDHSLAAAKAWLKSQATTQDEIDAAISSAIASFLQSLPNDAQYV